jgi:hypothetical protein
MDPQEPTRDLVVDQDAGVTDTGPPCPVTWLPDIIRAAIPVSRAMIITSIADCDDG